MQQRPDSSLVFRVRDRLCALRLEHVEEIMRPLTVEAIAGAPVSVRGVAVVRGALAPVVDASTLLCGEASAATRFVIVKTSRGCVALAVDAVLGLAEIPSASVDALPPLFQETGADAISAIGVLDGQLLLVLRSTRLLPDDAWSAIHAAGASA
jgi:purine-binding chemotaxis protein CheW